jgi:hypothetical protein
MYWKKCRNGISRIYGSGKISGKLVLTKKLDLQVNTEYWKISEKN